jgi:hypothetical protein
LEVRWETVAVGGALLVLAACLVVQIVFRVSIARIMEARLVARRTVPTEPSFCDLLVDRPGAGDHDGGSPSLWSHAS